MAAGRFPKAVQLGSRSVGWIEAEIEEWIVARITQRNDQLKSKNTGHVHPR